MDSYDVVILGAGAGAKLIWGAVPDRTVGVVEQSRVGGDCPFVACVPSKAMLRTAHVWRATGNSPWESLVRDPVSGPSAYAQAVRRRDRIVRGRDDSDNAAGLARAGATLLRGSGRIVRPGVLDVSGTEVGYGDLVLNTGSTPAIPEIPGLDSVPVWTSDEALSTDVFPESAVVLGGGPVGCELAHLFAAFGSDVTLVQRGSRLLAREEQRASDALLELLEGNGVHVRLETQVVALEPSPTGGARATLSDRSHVDVEVLMLATGRRPRSTDLGLEVLGVDLADGDPVRIDESCRVVRTDDVWAVGDVTGLAPFTHTAHYQGRVVAANLSGRDTFASYAAIPRAVYTDPVFAAVGHTEESARAAGLEPVVVDTPMSKTIRSTTEAASAGWLRMIANPVDGTVVGASAMGGYAEEWISEVSLMIRARVPIDVAKDVVHPFPTFSEVLEIPLWELADRVAELPGG